MADEEILKRKEEAEREDEERQQRNATLRRDTGQKGDAAQGQSPLQNKMNSLEARVQTFEAYFNSFTIVGGDGVEVSGNLRAGFIINAHSSE